MPAISHSTLINPPECDIICVSLSLGPVTFARAYSLERTRLREYAVTGSRALSGSLVLHDVGEQVHMVLSCL